MGAHDQSVRSILGIPEDSGEVCALLLEAVADQNIDPVQGMLDIVRQDLTLLARATEMAEYAAPEHFQDDYLSYGIYRAAQRVGIAATLYTKVLRAGRAATAEPDTDATHAGGPRSVRALIQRIAAKAADSSPEIEADALDALALLDLVEGADETDEAAPMSAAAEE